MNDDEFLASLREDFAMESHDLLDAAESEILLMEKDQNTQHLIEINRSLHSLKGSARAVGFTEFSQILHEVETLISKASKPLNHSTQFLTHLLQIIDAFKNLTSAHAENSLPDIQSNLTKLKNLLNKI
jgi:two-component system chemotaxis sensor kinase CheA